MNGRRVEHHHNTGAQVEGYIDEALRMMARLEVTDELLVPAFTLAVQLLASKDVQIEQVTGTLDHLAIPNRR